MGSISSKKYSKLWKQELKENPHLFHLEIISYHDTRSDALWKELQIQKIFNIVKNPLFVNLSYAKQDGYFGMKCYGEEHPQYGKTRTSEQNKRNSEIQKDPSIQIKKKETSLKNFGVDHASKSKIFQENKKIANKIKYGFDSHNSNDLVKQKQAKTKRNNMIIRFGCNSQKEIFDKIFIFEQLYNIKQYKNKPNLSKILKYFPTESHKSIQFLQRTFLKYNKTLI
jgi:hypothetical protein